MKKTILSPAGLLLLALPAHALVAPDASLTGIPALSGSHSAANATARPAPNPEQAIEPVAAIPLALPPGAALPPALPGRAAASVRQLTARPARTYAGSPGEAARAFLVDAHRIPADSVTDSGVGEPSVSARSWGHQVVFPQEVNGIPVLNRGITVNLDREGLVLMAEDATAPLPSLNTTPAISALRVAGMARGTMKTPPSLAIRVDGLEPRLVWRFTEAGDDLIPVRVTVDADSGDIIERTPLAHFATGQGLVYRGNPVSTPTREVLPLTSLNGTGYLTGTYTDIGLVRVVNNILSPNRTAVNAGLDFSFAPDSGEMSQTQAYYGISHVHDWFKSTFNFTGRDHVIPGFVRNMNYANAYFTSDTSVQGYSTPNGYMLFGYGGTAGNPARDFALDTDVLYHEFTHSVVDKISPGLAQAYGQPEQGGINEAVADYFSSTILNDPVLGEYAGGAYGLATVRDLKSRNHYPEEVWTTGAVTSGGVTYPDIRVYPEVHQTGEIWGPALWDLRTVLGPQKTDQLVFEGTSLLTGSSVFQGALSGLLMADDLLYGGVDKAAIRDVFSKRGITESAYPVKYQPSDAFYSAAGPGKIKLGRVYLQNGYAMLDPYFWFPSFNVGQSYQFIGYVFDSQVQTVVIVLADANNNLVSAFLLPVKTFQAMNSSGQTVTWQYFWTFGPWPDSLIPAGQTRRSGLRLYLYSFAEPSATVQANFFSLTPLAVAPSGAGYPAELQRAQTTPPIAAPGFGDTDGNGKVQLQDAVLVTRAVAGVTALTAEQKVRADVASPLDGNPNIADARAILRRVGGLL